MIIIIIVINVIIIITIIIIMSINHFKRYKELIRYTSFQWVAVRKF